jgi:hypothetical protein
MRKFLLIAASLVIASAVAAAQMLLNSYEVPVRGTLTVTADVMLGTSTLKEGIYNYSCDRENITFANPNSGKTVLKVPCKGRELPAPIGVTTMVVKKDASGKRVVTKLLLKGSNIEHVFQ